MIFERVAELAKERGIAITALEETAGLGRGTIGKWRESKPTISTIEKVAKALEVPIAKLLED